MLKANDQLNATCLFKCKSPAAIELMTLLPMRGAQAKTEDSTEI